MTKKKLGEILVEAGLVSTSTVEEALNNKREDQKIGDYLVEKGHVREELMYEKLSSQLKIPLFKLSELEIKQNALDSISKDILFEYNAFPIELSGSLLTLAMENPMEDYVLKELEKKLDLDISAVFGLKSEILDYISKYYEIDESMTEIFGMRENSNSDRNELQIADTFINYLKSNKKLNIVFNDTRGNINVKMGKLDFLSKKDIGYLLDFLKKTVGYDDVDKEFSVLLNQSENKIRLSMKVIRSKTQTEYWVESFWLSGESFEEVFGLEDCDKNGIYVILNEKFEATEKFKKQLKTLKELGEKETLVNTSDITYEKLGLDVLDVPFESVIEYTNFADVFVFDYGWEIHNVAPLLRLLREDKTILLHTPFSSEDEFKEYVGSIGVLKIIEKFIKSYVVIK